MTWLVLGAGLAVGLLFGSTIPWAKGEFHTLGRLIAWTRGGTDNVRSFHISYRRLDKETRGFFACDVFDRSLLPGGRYDHWYAYGNTMPDASSAALTLAENAPAKPDSTTR